MKILILGIDGYLGWPLAQYLANKGHEVSGVDDYSRRQFVKEMRSDSAIPIAPMFKRREAFQDYYGYKPDFMEFNIYTSPIHLISMIRQVKPDTIVHFAEVPSAPFSMHSLQRARYVMTNNVIGTLGLLYAMKEAAPEAHLLKLGTMGEYGTPNCDIPEGFFHLTAMSKKDDVLRTAKLPFPRQAGSWYHWSKVHDSNNIMFACNIWGLRSTDIMQGVVYGTWIEEMEDDPRMRTRLDYDESFGTVLNRFVCQAIIGHPLTVYGDVGKQTRGFLPLGDSMQCLTLAIENAPEPGEYRVFNQFEDVYSVIQLAEKVKAICSEIGMDVAIAHYEAPRVEAQEHYYNPENQKLLDLGYKPDMDMDAVIRIMIADLLPNKDRIKSHKHVLIPEIFWNNENHVARKLDDEL
ncbi:hypothetical protein LCGC14_1113230 [marine sediment metagenome]|uniref:NAD-dependent epimerase/dehydratase domain-containing protein n=1 Tax=marine sediment metagenome TaxID=412755 RepID=A0A0F9MU27_9ZZZZ